MVPLPQFRGLDPRKPVRIYHRHLPHWRQDGALYFVTFGLADAIPQKILNDWALEREQWLCGHGIDPIWQQAKPQTFAARYEAIAEDERREFESRQARRLHIELDHGHGCSVLRHPEAAMTAAEAMRFFDGQRWWLGDLVIMPNHVHVLILPLDDWSLEDVLGSVKKYVSRRMQRWAARLGIAMPEGGLWQQESYDRIVRDRGELIAYRQYIRDNPGKARLGESAFVYESAAWLEEWAPISE